MRSWKLWLLLSLTSILASAAWSAPSSAGTTTPKVALGLYKGSEEPAPEATRLAVQIRPALEALGWKLQLWDIEQGLPPAAVMGKTGAVVTWFASPKMADSVGYVRWLARQNQAGKKVVLLGNFGAHTSDGNSWLTNEQLNEFFYPFGLDYRAAYTAEGSLLKLVSSDRVASAPPSLTYYLLFRSANPGNRVHLTVSRTDLAGSESALVVTTPHGGMAQETYLDTLDKKAFLAAAMVQGQAEKVTASKRILGLYKSSEKQSAENNHIVKFAQKPLFDLGYSIDFHDITSGLPSAEQMASYQAVLSWYQGPEMRGAAQYAEWLRRQMEAGRKVLILGNYGAFSEDVPTPAGPATRFLLIDEYNRFFYPFGLEFRAAWTPDRSKVKVVGRDPEVVPWLPAEHVGHYFWIRSVNPANQPFLTVDRADLDEGEATVVVATPHGGLALESYILKEAPGKLDPDFHLDLKRFFQACLAPSSQTASSGRPAIERPARPALPRLDDAPTPLPAGVTRHKRKVLAFYQRQFKELPDLNSVHQSAETVLNYLGLVVEYRAVEDPLPSDLEMEQYRGIVVWFNSGEMTQARAFDAWLRRQIAQGRRIAMLGTYAATYESQDKGFVDPGPTFAALGLRYRSLGQKPTVSQRELAAFNAGRRGKEIKLADPRMTGFERPFNLEDKDVAGWPLITSVGPENKVYLTLSDSEGDSDLVVLTPHGGIAMGPASIYLRPGKPFRLSEGQAVIKSAEAEARGGAPWRIDPYLFFSQALQTDSLPKPDFTTLNGARITYSHIDGDAFGGISLIDRNSLNGAMMERRMLRELKLPVTVSFVTDDIEKKQNAHYWQELEVARSILALPNVEPASHTANHPFEWVKGDMVSFQEGKVVRTEIDLEREIRHSVDFIDRLLAPPEKRCEILLWTGRCNPPAEAVALTRQLGLVNMNGGETVYDAEHPYVAGILPVSRQVGEETQVHVSAAGDFHYTGSWTRDYDGMKNLAWFFEHTESPRRLRALNVYYHFYLAERQPGLDGLNVAYADILRRDAAPMYASDYARVIGDFLVTELGHTAAGDIYVRNQGALRTLRFDAAEGEVDVAASRGVLGSSRHNGSLYVHLDEATEHTIVFARAPLKKVPELTYFTHYAEKWSADPEMVSFRAQGQGPVLLRLSNLTAGAHYSINVRSPQGEKAFQAQAGSDGRLEWRGEFVGYRAHHDIVIRKVK